MRQAILAGLLAVMAAPGCMKAAEQGMYTVAGATPRYLEVQDLAGPTILDPFKAVGVEPFDASPMLGRVPPAIVPETQASVAEKLAETRMFATVIRGAPPAGGLAIRGKFVDFDPGGSALRAVGFGVNPFLTAQIELIDTGANRRIGVAMVTGTVKSAVRTGTKELADGVAKAVKGLVERHHTKVSEKAPAAGATKPAEPKKGGFRWPWSKS